MTTNLSRFFQQRRITQKISFGDLARELGYTNLVKGANRIIKFEQNGSIHPDLFNKLASALKISTAEIRQCVEADKAEWDAWADEPIEPHLVVRLMAAIYSPKKIPTELQASRTAMEEYASAFSREKGMLAFLVLSRRTRVCFDRDGKNTGSMEDTFERSYGPYMRIGGRKFLLNLLGDGGSVVKTLDIQTSKNW